MDHPSSSTGARPDNKPNSFSDASADVRKLQQDMADMKDNVASFVAGKGKDAAKTLKNAGQTVSDAAADAYHSGAEMAGAAGEKVKTFATEIESMARKNPLGAMAAAVCVGVLIGLIGRGRN
jgi:ElaB/YqjD/DUF883 family membrane-anchored ribosome-binding protein